VKRVIIKSFKGKEEHSKIHEYGSFEYNDTSRTGFIFW
jgi:hypothetical protein